LDVEKRLLIRAALAEPKISVPAWNEWRANFAGPNASSSLAWAGGYVYKNLLAAGVDDAFAKGIYRHNWLSNISKKSKLVPTLREISKITRVTPLKTFGFSHAKHSFGLRPIADLDIFVGEESLEATATRLVELEFLPLMGLSLDTILEHIRIQRGSWNFKDATGNDIDLHWKAFDHISVSENERILRKNTQQVDTEFGPANYVSPAFSLTSQIYVHALQGEERYNGLFDIFNTAGSENIDAAGQLIKELDFRQEAEEVIEELRDVLDTDPSHPLGRLGHVLSGSSKLVRPRARIQSQRLSQIPDSSLRFPRLYRAWVRAGASPFLERLHSLFLGPMTSPKLAIELDGSLELRLDELPNLIPAGFHYQYPVDHWRWVHKGDARIRFDIIALSGKSRTSDKREMEFTIDLDERVWGLTPTLAIEIYCNGQKMGNLDKSSAKLNLVFSIGAPEFEISFRTRQRPSPLEHGIRFNWYQMLCPVGGMHIKTN
jgi:hypothetical protein